MNRDEFNAFCDAMKATTNVIQWGNASVWKIGGKIFAISSIWGEDNHQKISFKCSDLSYQILCELEGIIPAPYLARAKWVQLQDEGNLSDGDIRSYVEEAYSIVSAKLTKVKRKELDIYQDT